MNKLCDPEIMNDEAKQALAAREKKALGRLDTIVNDLGLSKREVMALVTGYERGKNKGVDDFAERLNSKLILPPDGKDSDFVYTIKDIILKIEQTKKELLGVKG